MSIDRSALITVCLMLAVLIPISSAHGWGQCVWVRPSNSHQPGPDWCPNGWVITALDLDGDRRLDPHDAPIVGQAKCCQITRSDLTAFGNSYPEQPVAVTERMPAGAIVVGDVIFQKGNQKLWRMFEDEEGLYVENLKTGKSYRLLLGEEVER